jgi:hypothetical protein
MYQWEVVPVTYQQGAVLVSPPSALHSRECTFVCQAVFSYEYWDATPCSLVLHDVCVLYRSEQSQDNTALCSPEAEIIALWEG